MSAAAPTVFVVDDDPSVLKALARLIRAAGRNVETFSSPREFLEAVHEDRPGCVVLDLRMPEVSGLDLQALLERAGSVLPVIFLSGHADVPTSVAAMKAGAVDFLTKPCDDAQLLAAIEGALERDARARAARDERDELAERFAGLTPREQEVCRLVAQGLLNKQAAYELGITERTIKVHRARVMQKLGVGSFADLVRLVERLKATPGRS